MEERKFSFTFEENEDGFTIKVTGPDKAKLKAKLEAMEAYINYREKAAQAGMGFHGMPGGMHSFFKSMYEVHAEHFGRHGFCHEKSCRDGETGFKDKE